MGFRVVPLSEAPFRPLADLSGEALARSGVERLTVETPHSTPCRVTLEDAEPGESVWLLPHRHHDVTSPYAASGPIFVREKGRAREYAPGEIPEALRRRLLSVRAYDAAARMTACDVVPGTELSALLERYFERAEVAYAHVHFAKPGCYACAIERVPG